jgi:tRNA pseudouridine55 synthase
VRSLARDIGAMLEVGGYLHALRRVASGSFRVEECCTLDALQAPGAVAMSVVPNDRALLDMPAAVLDESMARDARTGRPLHLGTPAAGTVRLYGPSGEFIGVGKADGGAIRPVKIFAGAA